MILSMTVVGKMIAGVSAEHGLLTGARQERLSFSASVFLTQAALALGTLAHGCRSSRRTFRKMQRWRASIKGVRVGAAFGGMPFGAITIRFYSRIQLTQDKHTEIVRELSRPPG